MLSLLLLHQMIDIKIDYSKFETLIRIDIEYRPEQTFISVFSIGFRIDDQLFDKNGFKNQNDSQFLINEIFIKNHSRKILSVDTQHKNLHQTYDLTRDTTQRALTEFNEIL